MLCYHCMREKGDADVCPYCSAQGMPVSQPHHLHPGTVIGNRYTIGRVLGEGGFGITYIGRSNTLELPVAVKEYYPYGYCNRNAQASTMISVTSGDGAGFYEKGRTRFLSEAKILAKFKNEPGIVDVIDFLEENNTAYIVMEYLDGVTLRDYIRFSERIEPVKAVQMLMPVMQALEKVHAKGIIHRDISPDNIMMLRDGSLKLMDFGAARGFEGDSRSMSVMLKQGYAPEEQYRRNGEQGQWTDVYAICATLYRLITGVTPPASIDRAYQDTLTPPSAQGVRIIRSLENTLMYGLAIYKKDRCQDMGTLIALFEKAVNDQKMTMDANVPVDQSPAGANPDLTVIADANIPFGGQGNGGQPPYNGRLGHNPPPPYNPHPGQQQGQGGWYPPQGYRPPQPVQPVQKKRSVAPIIAVISVVLALSIVAGAVIFIINNNNNTPDNIVVPAATVSSSGIAPSAQPAVAVMPDLTGKTKEQAVSALAQMDLTVTEVMEVERNDKEPGKVFTQVPKSGADVTQDTKITLYIAKEGPTVKPTEKPSEKPTEKKSSSSTGSSGSSNPSGTYYYCTADTYVSVHSSASASSSELCKIWRGQAAKYLGKSGNYYHVDFGGVKGYAHSDYLSSSSSDIPYQNSAEIWVNSNVTSEGLALRESYSESAAKLAAIPANGKMEFLNKCAFAETRSNGYHPQWIYVRYGNQYGYVYDYYVHD